jgi:hypothetical protein
VGLVRIGQKAWLHTFAELVFLHLVGSTGHVVHSGAFGARNIDKLLFMLRWDWYEFDKKSAETRYAELVFLYPMGHTGHVVHSGAFRVRNVDELFYMLGWAWGVFHKKARWDTLC